MNPEDRVLVAVAISPRDFAIARDEGWYRIPQKRVPKGIHAEYVAFYFNRAFGAQKWAIHYFGRHLGHELARRRDLLPEEADHPRAEEVYYKIQLGPLQQLERPIVSLRWRRISFIHTTWDRLIDATEINDLLVEGAPYVDRLYYALREAGILPERRYHIHEAGAEYKVELAIPCVAGMVSVIVGNQPGPTSALRLTTEQMTNDPAGCESLVKQWVRQHGGARPLGPGSDQARSC